MNGWLGWPLNVVATMRIPLIWIVCLALCVYVTHAIIQLNVFEVMFVVSAVWCAFMCICVVCLD